MRSFDCTHSHVQGLFLREYGSRPSPEAKAKPIVWVHGLGESGLCFEEIAADRRLAGWHHLVPDLPGYGRSPWTREPMSLAQAGIRLCHWLKEEGLFPATFVGHSMGGVLVQILAEQHPEAVAAFVNVDGNISSEDCVFSAKAVATNVDDFLEERFDRLRDGVYRLGAQDKALRGYYASLRLADPRAFHLNSGELVELSRSGNLAGRMASLEVPTLYIAGRPGGASKRSLELLDQAGVPSSIIKPSGHWPFLDQPDGFVDQLRSFLRLTDT